MELFVKGKKVFFQFISAAADRGGIIPNPGKQPIQLLRIFTNGKMQLQVDTRLRKQRNIVIIFIAANTPALGRQVCDGAVKILFVHQNINITAGAQPRLGVKLADH